MRRTPRLAAAGPAPAAEAVVVALAGRPNAGKSTLFNRLLGRRHAIVDDQPGVTRDENRAVAIRDGSAWELVDTGGIEERALEDGLADRVQRRSLEALRRADVIVYVVDGRAGLSAPDRAVAARLRALGRPTLVAVNKLDRPEHDGRRLEFLELGLSDPVAVSAAHGLGVTGLWERIEELAERGGRPEAELPCQGEAGEGGAAAQGDPMPPRIALVGRPNVGKSSLLNRIVGFERALVDARPGTTRDAIDVAIERGARRYVIVDTAGLRRPSRVFESIESHAAAASIRAIARAEAVVLVLDATIGVTDQDLRLADLVWRRGRGLLIAVNKVDLAPKLAAEQCHQVIAQRLPQWPPLPLLRLSALEGTGLRSLFTAVDQVVDAYRKRLPTPQINALVGRAVAAHAPPLVRGRTVKLLYAAQVRSAPHEIAIFVNRAEGLPVDYQRYLLHFLREELGLVGVPLKLSPRLRSREPRERRAGESAATDATRPRPAPKAARRPRPVPSRARAGAAPRGRRSR